MNWQDFHVLYKQNTSKIDGGFMISKIGAIESMVCFYTFNDNFISSRYKFNIVKIFIDFSC